VSSPTEHLGAHGQALRLFSDLADPDRRVVAARSLAELAGGEALLVFLLDPVARRYLPAPGFPQRLPDGRAWRAFLDACVHHGRWTGDVPYHADGHYSRATGIHATADAILVLVGGAARGGHAYRTLEEVFVALSGSFDLTVDDGRGSTVRQPLNRSYYGVYVPALMWRKLSNFSTNAVCLILASRHYDERDYVRDYDAFCDMRGAATR